MDTNPTFGLRDVLTHVIAGAAKALCDRPEESQARSFERSQAVTATILTFQPHDAIEAMLASHCVIFHELIVDTVHTTLNGEDGKTRRATRANIVAMDKAFGNNLTRLERQRTGDAKISAPASDGGGLAETDIADRIRRHEAPARAETPPAEAWPDALAGLNRQTRREFLRQARKRGIPAPVRLAVTPNHTAPATGPAAHSDEFAR